MSATSEASSLRNRTESDNISYVLTPTNANHSIHNTAPFQCCQRQSDKTDDIVEIA